MDYSRKVVVLFESSMRLQMKEKICILVFLKLKLRYYLFAITIGCFLLCFFRWEEKLGTSHMPEMVFGESSLSLLHITSGIKLHFNALDALRGWKQESLPPVEVPAAAKWKFRRFI